MQGTTRPRQAGWTQGGPPRLFQRPPWPAPPHGGTKCELVEEDLSPVDLNFEQLRAADGDGGDVGVAVCPVDPFEQLRAAAAGAEVQCVCKGAVNQGKGDTSNRRGRRAAAKAAQAVEV